MTDSSTGSLLYGDPDSPFRDPDMVALDPGAERRDGKLGDIEHLISTEGAGPALREKLRSQDWELGELNPGQEDRLLGCLRSLTDPTDQARAMEAFGGQLAQASSGFREKLLGVIEEMSQAPEFSAGRHAVPMAIVNCVGSNAFTEEQCGRLRRYLGGTPGFDNNIPGAIKALDSAVQHARQSAQPAAATVAMEPPSEVAPGESQLGGLEAAFRINGRPLSSEEARDAVLAFPLEIEELGADQQGRLLRCLDSIQDPLAWAAALEKIGPKLSKATPEFRQAVIAKIRYLGDYPPDSRERYAIANAAIHCTGPGAVDLTSEELSDLQVSLASAPDGYFNRIGAEANIRSMLQARQAAAPSAAVVAEAREARLQELEAFDPQRGVWPPPTPAQQSAALRDAVLNSPLEIGELDPAQQARVFRLLERIGNPRDWAAAMGKIGPKLSSATPEFRRDVLVKIRNLGDYPEHSDGRLAIADAIINFAVPTATGVPTVTGLTADELEHLQGSLQLVPAYHSSRQLAEIQIGNALRGWRPAPPPAVVAAEAREARLQELEAFAPQQAWPPLTPAQQSAALRDTVLNSSLEIDKLNPAQQERVFRLLERIENPRDWAAAMGRIGPRLGEATPEFRGAVLGKIRYLSNSRHVDSDRLAVADAVVSCAGPSAARLTTAELMDLQDSLGRVPGYHPQRHIAELQIGTALRARQPGLAPVMHPAAIEHAVMSGHPAGQESAMAAIEGIAYPVAGAWQPPGQAAHQDGMLGAALFSMNSRIDHVSTKLHGRISNSLNAIKHPGNWASAVSGFGAKLGKAGREVRTAVFNKIDEMGNSLAQKRDYAVEAAVGTAIVHCAGPSAAVFTPEQRASLLRHADRLDPNGIWRVPAMNSLRQGWPKWPYGRPSYEETLVWVRPPPPVPPRPQQAGQRPATLMNPAEQDQFLDSLDQIGNRLGEAAPGRRALVLDQIDLMSDPANNAGWNAAIAIVKCAGPSVRGLSAEERSRLVGNALRIQDSFKAVDALLSIKTAWPDGGPTFDDVLVGKARPAWVNDIREIVVLLNQEVLAQNNPPPAAPPRARPVKTRKGKAR